MTRPLPQNECLAGIRTIDFLLPVSPLSSRHPSEILISLRLFGLSVSVILSPRLLCIHRLVIFISPWVGSEGANFSGVS
ncbi:hypothetical protein M407DRAFT_114049 [Tulasnella calospora MUT 4182]|uniref:Uncharacterized protein n=1 Tax=Tulasnella calospora MUT 4182 TaxID=1051891 RepID=A0A0C3QDS0_9AGAM|nr:hypothetical protein M407DRAFT_114049 [Tulasnella calospora MUT 4182]